MPFHQHQLANGLQIIGESSPSARSAAVGFFVRTGSRDETADVSGVSHFLEHMVFKGTPHRTALQVNLDFDRIGADYNAFTSEENTVFHAAVLPEYLPNVIDILADILRPSLRVDDFEMEKKVILEEIGMYDDQPSWCAYDNAKRIHFASHQLGNSILGSNESITALTAEQMLAYFKNRYIAPNITVAVAGNLNWPEIVQDIEKRCASWPGGKSTRSALHEAPASCRFETMVKEKINQEHVILLAQGPPAQSPLRFAASLLAMAVGDDSGSRLYWELVDPGLAESAEFSFHEYDGTGAFFTFLSCEPEQAQANIEAVGQVLARVQTEGITQEELLQARSKILSRLVRSSERPKGRMMVLGMNWLYQHEYRSLDTELESYQTVTLEQIRKVLDQYPLTRVTTLALGPSQSLHPVEHQN